MGKKEVKLSLFSDDMVLYIENPKDTTEKLEFNEFGKVAWYKINIQKSVAFLYTDYELSERNFKNSPIYHHIKKNRIPRNKSNWGDKKTCTWKTIRHCERNWRWHRWKDIPCSWTGRINTVKMTIFPKAIYRFNETPTKILNIFHPIRINNSKICM